MDDRSHVNFDRMINRKHRSRLPYSTRRRIQNGLRAAYTTIICIYLSTSWPWGGTSSYLSPMLSITSSSLYLGKWQGHFWEVLCGAVYGGIYGVLIGYLYNHSVLLVLLLFFGLAFFNKCSIWNRTSKVFSSLCLLLGCLWPVLSNNTISGRISIQYMFSIVTIPFLISGFTLLFPIPGLACISSIPVVLKICYKISIVTAATIRAFGGRDYLDLYSAEIEHLHREIHNAVDILVTLIPDIEWESIPFPTIKDYPQKLHVFAETVKLICAELEGLRDVLQEITHNHTQARFVEALFPSLQSIDSEIAIEFRLIYEYLSDFRVVLFPFNMLLPSSWIDNASQFVTKCFPWILTLQRNDDRTVRSYSRIRQELGDVDNFLWESSDRMIGRKLGTYYNSHDSTSPPPMYNDSALFDDIFTLRCKRELFMESGERLLKSKSELLDEYQRTRREHVWNKPEMYVQLAQHPQFRLIYHLLSTHKSALAGRDLKDDKETVDQSNLKDLKYDIPKEFDRDLQILLEENQTLHNLSPRGAYIQRLCTLVNLVHSCHGLFDISVSPWSPWQASKRVSTTAFHYARDSILEFVAICAFWIGRIQWLGIHVNRWLRNRYEGCSTQSEHSSEKTDAGSLHNPQSLSEIISHLLSRKDWEEFRKYTQCLKISLAITLASLLVIIPSFRRSYDYGLWTTIVIALIRHETTSSSFLVGSQRLEGTVIGAIYAFACYQGFNCAHSTCGHSVQLPVLGIWVAICAFFREGPQHGYAAVVASFTPIVLFLGSASGSSEGAWFRVEKTMVGIALYLVVDNLIFPNRTDTALRRQVLEAVEATKVVVHESFGAVYELVGNDREYFLGTKHKPGLNDVNGRGMKKTRSTGSLDVLQDQLTPSPTKPHRSSFSDLSQISSQSQKTKDILMKEADSKAQQEEAKQLKDKKSGWFHLLRRDHQEMISHRKLENESEHQLSDNYRDIEKGVNLDRYPGELRDWRSLFTYHWISRPSSQTSSNSTMKMTGNSTIATGQNGSKDIELSTESIRRRIDRDLTDNKENASLPSTPIHDGKDSLSQTSSKLSVASSLPEEPKSENESHNRVDNNNGGKKDISKCCDDDNCDSGKYDIDNLKRKISSSSVKGNLQFINQLLSNACFEWDWKRKESFERCSSHLQQGRSFLDKLDRNLREQRVMVKEVVHEPEIWHRPFPVEIYADVLHAFEATCNSGRTLIGGSRIMLEVMIAMSLEQIKLQDQLDAFAYMYNEILNISSRVEAALQLTCTALHRLYEMDDYRTDLSGIITLSKFLDRLLMNIDDHFKFIYSTRASALNIDTELLVAWQNVFEGICDLVKKLSKLGIALHNLRDVEALVSSKG